MRFERIRVAHFGGLHHLDTGDDDLGALVVVQGPNESGKSTFFHFLTSMLYGFRPANSGLHPYAPWSGDEIEGEAVGRLDEGASWSVTRRLRSSPWGRLVTDGRETELRNRTLPFVDHVPRSVFQKVFALTLHELGTLDGETWATLQDRLLARLTQDDLRSARDVVSLLRTEANALWRPDQRGRPRARTITADVLERQRERRTAVERDQQLRRADRELRRHRRELDEVREALRMLEGSVERLERLLPGRRLLARIRRLEASVDRAGLEGLPADPVHTLERLRTEAKRSEQAVRTLVADMEAAAAGAPEEEPGDRELLEARDTILAHEDEFESLRDRRIRLEAAQEELLTFERRVDALAAELFGPSGAMDGAQLDTLPLGALAEEVDRFQALRETRRARQAAVSTAPPDERFGGERVGLVSLVGGILLVAIGAFTSTTAPTGLGLALIAVAALALVLRWDRSRRRPAGVSAADLEQAQAAERAGLDRIRGLLDGAPIRKEILADPRPEAVARLRELREQSAEVGSRRERLEDGKRQLGELEAEARVVLDNAGLPVVGRAPERTLLRALSEALARDALRTATSSEIERLASRRPSLEQFATECRDEWKSLEVRLAALGDGDVRSGAEAAERGQLATARLDEALQELDELGAEPASVERELSDFEQDLGRPVGEDALAEARREMATVREHELRLSEVVTGLERDVLHLEKERTVAVLDGEIEALKEERTGVQRERDRLTLLGNILEEADRRFRDRHQPDVVRRSGHYLSRITNERYERLITGEGDADGQLFLQTGGGRAVDVNGPLSTGTKEQVLLSLRLAVADHLDASGERMPLFIDEAFVNWDDGRQDRGLELVRELSRERQIFVFTCHQRLADALREGGGRLVSLERLAS